MENEKRRLIDANALKSVFRDRYDRAFMQMHSRTEREYWDGVCGGVNWGINTITDAPTVDAVEVVRCKDCIFASLNTSNGTFKCTTYNGMHRTVEAWEYCFYGERKDNDNSRT